MDLQVPDRFRKLNAFTLKMIAIITMLIDHTAAVFNHKCQHTPGFQLVTGTPTWKWLRFIVTNPYYRTLRDIGRIAFPIFCFFIVEGFVHTRSRRKYILRLFLFGLISEIPFDLALAGKPFYWKHQNVMFEMCLGVIMLLVVEYLWYRDGLPNLLRLLLEGAVIAGCLGAAYLLHLDYRWKGLFLILILYIFRHDRLLQCAAGAAAFIWYELTSIFSFPLLAFYNGHRGRPIKYFFYIFYPAHLLILYLLAGLLIRAS